MKVELQIKGTYGGLVIQTPPADRKVQKVIEFVKS